MSDPAASSGHGREPGAAGPAQAVAACIDRSRQAGRTWAAEPPDRRMALIGRVRRRIAAGSDELVEAVRLARPRPEAEILSSEILPLADAAAFLEREGAGILAPERLGGRAPRWLGRVEPRVERIPMGVVLIVGPGNYPLFLPGVQALQALAAGNAVVLKPAPGGSAAADALAGLLETSGLPAGLFTVLEESPHSVAAALAAGVDKVVLTGSAATGQQVLEAAAATLTPATMELSGCDAVFVLDSADLRLTARALRFGLLLNGGATCIAPRRVFVTRDRLPQLEAALNAEFEAAAAESHPVADAERMGALTDDALARGGRLLLGGAIGSGGMPPTILTDTPADSELLRQEVFAPLLALVPVDTMQQAVALDAECPFALGASIFGGDREAGSLARTLRAGVVVVNDLIAPTADPRISFGGGARSGFGVTRGREGLLEMTRPQTTIHRPGSFRPHLDAATPDTLRLLSGWLRAAHSPALRDRAAGLVHCIQAIVAMARPRRRPSGIRQTQE